MAPVSITRTASTIVFIVILLKTTVCFVDAVRLGFKTGIEKQFVSDKARVSLTCRSRDIVVNLNFSSPFRGLVHAGSRNSKEGDCSLRGDGRRSYLLNVPHESCGTIHVLPEDSFANTLTIRYHPALELEDDEIKTILCRNMVVKQTIPLQTTYAFAEVRLVHHGCAAFDVLEERTASGLRQKRVFLRDLA